MNKYEKYDINRVTVRDILLRCFDHINPYINFFYKDEDGNIRESEVVISPDELYDEIKDCTAGKFTISDNCLYIDSDIIVYINKVLKNPMYPIVVKQMLSAYKEKVLNGEIF